MSENGVAKLVGEKTFGKGSVQEVVPITDDTSLKVTIAKWLTPNGKSISQEGITPDIVVKLTTGFTKNSTTTKDTQLERAAGFLLTGK